MRKKAHAMNYNQEKGLAEMWKIRYDRCKAGGCSALDATKVADKVVEKARQMYISPQKGAEKTETTDTSEGGVCF